MKRPRVWLIVLWGGVLTPCGHAVPFLLETVALEGERAPVADPTAVFAKLVGSTGTVPAFGDSPNINNRGEVLFEGVFAGAAGTGYAAFVRPPGAFRATPVFYLGDPAPGAPGAVIADLFDTVLGDGGDAVFKAKYVGPGIEEVDAGAIFAGRAGALRLVVRESVSAPGTSFTFDHFGGISINRAGLTAFDSILDDGHVGKFAVHKESPAGLQLVAIEQQPRPGGTGDHTGGILESFGTPNLEDDGDVMVGARFSAYIDEVRGAMTHGLLLGEGEPTSLRFLLVAGERWTISGDMNGPPYGDPAPGPAFGYEFSDLGGGASNNDTEFVVASEIQHAVSGESVHGIFTEKIERSLFFPDRRVMRALVYDGDPAPDTAGHFDFENAAAPAINNPGRVAIFTRTDEPHDPDEMAPAGIWTEQVDGSLQLVIKSGAMIEVRPGDFRQVASDNFPYSGLNYSAGRGGFNDIGQVVFHVNFTDGTEGIFRTIVPGMTPEFPWESFASHPAGGVVAQFGVGTTGFGAEMPFYVSVPTSASLRFAIGPDDPSFQSVVIPELANSGNQFAVVRFGDMAIPVTEGQTLDFRQFTQGLGVNSFRIDGLGSLQPHSPNSAEPVALLNTDGAVAAIGLTFVRGGTDVFVRVHVVPEPSATAITLLAAALLALAAKHDTARFFAKYGNIRSAIM